MPFQRVTFLNAGHCTQLGYFAARRERGPTRFDNVVVVLEHPAHGVSMIDSGYSPHFFDATRAMPERLYRWTLPVQLADRASMLLDERGLRVETIFLSHFHGDHIAGLRDFPHARIVHRREAHDALMQKSTLRQVCCGFLPSLLPDDFDARAIAIEEARFVAGDGPFADFRVLDYWGDGDLLLVDLPGHSAGHMGFAFRTEQQRFFYIADACWDTDALLDGRSLPMASRWLQESPRIYDETQAKLRRFATNDEWQLLACHCPRTQAHVENR